MKSYSSSLYDSVLWDLSNPCMEDVCVASHLPFLYLLAVRLRSQDYRKRRPAPRRPMARALEAQRTYFTTLYLQVHNIRLVDSQENL